MGLLLGCREEVELEGECVRRLRIACKAAGRSNIFVGECVAQVGNLSLVECLLFRRGVQCGRDASYQRRNMYQEGIAYEVHICHGVGGVRRPGH